MEGSTFTCYGCGETVPINRLESHKKECKQYGKRNRVSVMDTPIYPVKKEDPYLKRKDVEAIAKDEDFKQKWCGWLNG